MNSDIAAWTLQHTGDDFVIPKYDQSAEVSGIHNVLQRVLCVLLTERGSVKYAFGRKIERACPFMSAWRRGMISSEAEVRSHFMMSHSFIANAIRAEELPDDPPEQRFKKLALTKIVVCPGAVRMYITLETEADKLDCVLPLPV